MIVEIEPKSIKLAFKNKLNEPIINGELFDRIKVDDSTWSIEDNNKIIFNLEKSQENIWKTVIKGDVEIDTKTVDNSKKLDEFD